MVLDATGHARKLVDFDRDFTPGYQAAFRDLRHGGEARLSVRHDVVHGLARRALEPRVQGAERQVADVFVRHAISRTLRCSSKRRAWWLARRLEFDDLKLKLKERLEHLGRESHRRCTKRSIALIPMGGVLPTFPQRTLGIGGTAGMVHPSTGFMVAKTMLCVRALVGTLDDALKAGVRGDITDALIAAEEGQSDNGTFDATTTAATIWSKLWPEDDLRMRTFMCFGMETLMQLDVNGTRQFFDTFFDLPKDVWAGFLSWRIQPAGLVQTWRAALRVVFELHAHHVCELGFTIHGFFLCKLCHRGQQV